jgi:glycosyltransferase involved in cell wall biosynthesis
MATTVGERRPRVLFVAGCWYPDHGSPYHGIFIRRHAQAVARIADVAVLHLAASPEGPDEPTIDSERVAGVLEAHVRVRGLPSGQGGRLQTQFSAWRAGRVGSDWLRRTWGEPDLLHIHVIPSPALVWAVRSVFRRRPYLVTEHWTGYLSSSDVRLGSLRRLATRRLVAGAHAVTTVSRDLARAMRSHGFDGRYEIVPNVVDTQVFRPPDVTPEQPPLRLVHVSLLRPVKNIVPTIRLVAELRNRGFAVELAIVGEGPERPLAIETARALGVLGCGVEILGGRDDTGIALAMRRSHALVLFSDYENSPCVIGEAMACGLPVFATRVGGIPDLVDSSQGRLVDPGDWSGAASAIVEAASEIHRFDRMAIRRFAEENLGVEAVGARFEALYRSMIVVAPSSRATRST